MGVNPQWQQPLTSAILEFNRDRLREKLQRAEEAIAQRIEQLAFDPGNEARRSVALRRAGSSPEYKEKTDWASPKSSSLTAESGSLA